MTNSILLSTKKVLGIEADYTAFDVDILMHINSVFATLSQLGIGPADGYMIEGNEETWDLFIKGDLNYNPVKSYTYLRVRLLFDPPTTSYLINSLNEQRLELEWRLNVHREGLLAGLGPTPPIYIPPDLDVIIDGGIDGGPPVEDQNFTLDGGEPLRRMT